PYHPADIGYRTAICIIVPFLDKPPEPFPDGLEILLDVKIFFRAVHEDIGPVYPREEPVVRDDARAGVPEEAVGLRGLPCTGTANDADAFSVDIDAGAVDRIDVVFVLEDVPGKAEGEGFDPAVILEIQEECGLGGRVVQHAVRRVRRVAEDEEPAMGPDILRHRIKVILPCVLQDVVIAEELDAAPVDLRFDLVPDLREIPLHQASFLFDGYGRNRVHGRNPPQAMIASSRRPALPDHAGLAAGNPRW